MTETPIPPGNYTVKLAGQTRAQVALRIVDGPEKGRLVFAAACALIGFNNLRVVVDNIEHQEDGTVRVEVKLPS